MIKLADIFIEVVGVLRLAQLRLINLLELEDLTQNYLSLRADLRPHLALDMAEVLHYLNEVHGSKILHEICQLLNLGYEKLNSFCFYDAACVHLHVGVSHAQVPGLVALELADQGL